jgi:hypothetical protein
MSRTKISEYSATAADNTDINAINIAEGCAPSGINNAIREMMKQLKDFQAGTAGDSLSVGGNLSYTGTLTGSTGILNIGSGQIYKDASGRVVVGASTARANFFNSTTSTSFQVEGTTADNSTISATRNTDTAAAGPFFILARARGSAVGSTTVIQDNDVVGSVSFQASDGTEFVEAARIQAIVNGAPGANDMPGALLFNTTADGAASSTERMRIDASGNVGIGTTSPASAMSFGGTKGLNAAAGVPTLRMYDDGTNSFGIAATSSGVSGLDISANFSAGNIRFFTGGSTASPTERARIDSSGNFLVGTTTNNTRSPRLALNGNSVTWSVGPSAVNSTFVVYNASEQGVFMGSGSTSWSSSSDERLKTDLVAIDNAAEKVATLRAVTGRYKNDQEDMRRSFLIAQDVQAVLPEAVDATDPDNLGLRYTEVIPLLTAAIQELKAELDSVKTELNILKGA